MRRYRPSVLAALAVATTLLGPYAVGFETTFVRDLSRADVSGSSRGRLVPVSVWYPAEKAKAALMRLSDYVDLLGRYETEAPSADTKRVGLQRFVETARERAHGKSRIDDHVASLLALETDSRRGAPPNKGRFPLVVFPEYRAPATNSAMAEVLASHGYVVTTLPMIGSFELEYEGGVTGIETQIADIRLAIQESARRPFVDATRLALIGVGMSANIAVAYHTRNADVDGIVSLDGGLPSPFENSVTQRSPYFDVAALRAPMLIIQAPFEGRDDELLRQYRFANRWHVEFPSMKEYYFLNYGPFEKVAPGLLGDPPGDVVEGHEWATRFVLAFLDETLRGRSSAVAELRPPDALLKTRFEKALPRIPTFVEWKRLIQDKGAGAATEEYQRLKSFESRPVANQTLFDLANWFGWQKDHDYAIRRALMTIATDSFPDSARSHFALGNACRAQRETACAIEAYEAALRVLPDDRDPLIDTAARERIARLAAERRDALRASQ